MSTEISYKELTNLPSKDVFKTGKFYYLNFSKKYKYHMSKLMIDLKMKVKIKIKMKIINPYQTEIRRIRN